MLFNAYYYFFFLNKAVTIKVGNGLCLFNIVYNIVPTAYLNMTKKMT